MGVDGQSWAGYAENLEENLQSLLNRAKSGTYRAPPVRRVHIPKGTGTETRPIGKWLNAGVLEDGCLSYPKSGSPQGGVVSPILANVFLHYVLDEWFAREVQPRLRGRAFLIRYADDFVIGFTHEEDARRVMAVLPKQPASPDR